MDWTKAKDRDLGTQNFCKLLDTDTTGLRGNCVIDLKKWTDPNAAALIKAACDLARRTFAKQGGNNFDLEEDFPAGSAPAGAIPKQVEFRIFEEDIPPRDYLVTMVLPPKGHVPTGNAWDVSDFYRCTWTPWVSLLKKVEYYKNKPNPGASH